MATPRRGRIRGEDVGAESGQLRVAADALGAQERAGSGRRTGPPRRARRRAPPRPRRAAGATAAARVDVPGAAHPQVAVQDELAEVEQQVLAVESIRPGCGRRAARSRLRGRAGSARWPRSTPDQGVVEPVLRAQDRVALGHPPIMTGRAARLDLRNAPARKTDPLARRRARDRRRADRDRGRRSARHPSRAEGARLRGDRRAGRALARIAGGRDIALGLLTFAARDDRWRAATAALARPRSTSATPSPSRSPAATRARAPPAPGRPLRRRRGPRRRLGPPSLRSP